MYQRLQLSCMETAGVEPASRDLATFLSTCVVHFQFRMGDGNELTSVHASPIDLFLLSSDCRLKGVSYYSWIIVTGHRKAHGMMQAD